jgi:hypothetical protein
MTITSFQQWNTTPQCLFCMNFEFNSCLVRREISTELWYNECRCCEFKEKEGEK